jgi:uncharacterized membrane protein
LTWAGLALGFGLGGFFDGILLHQVLQWHHLLSAVDGAGENLRLLILTDGLFHLLMYGITGIGLWLLWRRRALWAEVGADRRLLAFALIGFGTWHILDAVLSHWLLGIHRIRMDAQNPLAWDLGWLLAFGLLPAALGGWMLKRPTAPPGGPGAAGRRTGGMLLTVLALLAAPIAALPALPQGSATMVVLRPGTPPGEAIRGLSQLGGTLMWSNADDSVWAVQLPAQARPYALYRHGALLVSGTLLPAGCLDWFVPAKPAPPQPL